VSTGSCRACGATDLVVVLSLGEMPPANALLTERELHAPEARYPLELALCEACGLAQLTVSVDPAELFTEYAYFSSYSTTMLAHAEELVAQMIERCGLGPDSLATEIASNDGYLLQFYVRAGVPVLGIDPARNIVAQALERGVETLCDFFSIELAEELRASGHRADVLHANNVLAHVPDVNGVVRGMERMLATDGIAVIETPYVRDLVERLEFDTIYHEHLFYYSLTALDGLFQANGLRIVDVERIPIHGGSLRVFAAPAATAPGASPAVGRLLEEERILGVMRLDYFTGFAERVEGLRAELVALIDSLKAQGHRVAAYGAAAKGAVLLNAFDIGTDRIDFVVDRSEYKQGRFMPGVRLPIASPERLLSDQPDEVLLLAWNFAEEVLAQQHEYRDRGGRFIIPVPSPVIVG
jgi:SAM-dependent methyltransferase